MRQRSTVYCLAQTQTQLSTVRDASDKCSEIDSLAISSAPEQTGVTSFVQEACTAVDVLRSSTRTLIPTTPILQDLTTYFSRPQAIVSGSLNLSVRNRGYLLNINTASPLSLFTNGVQRMTGVYGYRATLVFTLQVAATPFHQGIMCLNWQYGTPSSGTASYTRNLRSETATNLPHVRLDLSTDTMVQLRVPFLASFEYFPLRSTSSPDYGSFGLNYLTAIQAVSGIVAPAYQILFHMEDMEFFGAAPVAVSSITLQSGKKLAPITEEFEQEAFPFSSATMALSRTVKWISKGIPLISSVGGPTSWFLEKAAGSIRSFGFARPQVQDPPMRAFVQDTINEQNVDVASALAVVGPFQSNTLRVGAIAGGSNVDEMALAYVLAQYCQINYFSIPVATAAGTPVYATGCTPSYMWFRAGATAPYCNIPPPIVAPVNTNSFQPSGLFHFSQMFKFWRGGIKFRFTFAKTKMHGGRVMVSYCPYNVDAVEATALGSKPVLAVAAYGTSGPDPFGYSAIYNLRDGNVFEFEVPYICPKPYSRFLDSPGSLAMYVVDPVQAPTVVAQSIQVMVEVCAMPDFELSNVRTPLYPVHQLGAITLQAGKIISETPDNMCEYTFGESFSSLKQLISIPKVTAISLAASTSTTMLVPPWFYQPVPKILVPAPVAMLTESFGFGGNISTCYAFVKGGTDLHFYMNQANNIGRQFITVAPSSSYCTTTITTQGPAQAPTSNNCRVSTSRNALHCRLPAMQQFLRWPSGCFDDIMASGAAWGINGTKEPPAVGDPYVPQTLYRLTASSGVTTTGFMSRSAADDAACLHYMGPPPLLLLSTNTVLSAYDLDSDVSTWGPPYP